MSDRDNDFGAFLTGFLVGGLVGAAVALLFAPSTGEETRTLIKDRSIELKDLAVERAEAARDRAIAAAEQARARAEALDRTSPPSGRRNYFNRPPSRRGTCRHDQRKGVRTSRTRPGRVGRTKRPSLSCH